MRSYLLITTFLIFPVIIFTDAEFIEVLNITISGNMKATKTLCSIIQFHNKNILKYNGTVFNLCFIEILKSSETKDILCKHSAIIFNKSNCTNRILLKFNTDFSKISLFHLISRRRNKFFLRFDWNNFEGFLQSSRIEVDGRRGIMQDKRVELPVEGGGTLTVELSFRERCPNGVDGCNKSGCEARDDHGGHYTCGEDGGLICLRGWKGLMCTEAICKECNNGLCLAPNKCKCYNGWSGITCNNCEKASRCKHGTCNSTVGIPFTCECKLGWGGQFCDIDLMYCLSHDGICQNNGICYNYYGDNRIIYLCKCAPGYFGRNCEIKTGDCIHSNDSLKQFQIENVTHKCRCYEGFSGLYCQINNTLQLEFLSLKKNINSDGFCVSPTEGYSCSCSKLKLKMCQCKFLKCSVNNPCIAKRKRWIFCSKSGDENNSLEIVSNFGFNPYPPIIISETIGNDYKINKNSSLQFYMGICIFIPIIFTAIILITIFFRFQFCKKSKASIKTIHNDLRLSSDIIFQPMHFNEQRFLLNQISESTSFQNDKCLNKMFIQNNITYDIKKEDTSKMKESEMFHKSPNLTRTNGILHDCNLLINNYKNIHDNEKYN